MIWRIVEMLRKDLVKEMRIDDVNYIYSSCYDDKDKVIEKGN